ncbi:YadA C-terminal domain-containing protein [Paraferrimonas sedimenticola]|uniref:Trimeric autotransporter adhesin YadA-like C-terminal membrane anchor domain-containing protein n=1 Tax=Paraferrimonas sedimenticola TaxID=375674 RepID=A0AA37VY49_9GAMM|nr:YadA C-terminal domain-containing protein [Paraferrimonas sedimenticola]GLP96896.1 hypothetical protein GCM10007895_22020 [Paraferrimonas sedimenticola]
MKSNVFLLFALLCSTSVLAEPVGQVPANRHIQDILVDQVAENTDRIAANDRINRKQNEAIEGLAEESQRTNSRLDQVNGELDSQRQRMNDIEKAGDELNTKVDDNTKAIEGMGDMFDQTQKGITDVKNGLVETEKHIQENNRRVDQVETGVEQNRQGVQNNANEIAQNRDGISHTKERLEREVSKQQAVNEQASSERQEMRTDIGSNRRAIASNTQAIADNRMFMEDLKAKTTAEIHRLDQRIDKLDGRLSNGVAMTGAMSQLQYNASKGVGVGIASFNGSNAIAIGAGYRFGEKQQWQLKGSVGHSQNSKAGNDTMAAAGLSYSFD